VTGDLLPEFAFQHSAHDRLSEVRGDADRLAKAWADPTTRVVVIRGLELATLADGDRLATVSPEFAPAGQRMLLGAADGVDYFLVIQPDLGAGAGSTGNGEGGPVLEEQLEPGTVFRPLRTVATSLGRLDASLAVHAVALAGWHAKHSRCAVCGAATEVAQAGASRVCPECGAQHFPRTDPAVIMLVVDDDDRCLLGHNAARDAAWYSTLAGFVEPGETLEDAVVREVAEETGVAVDSVTYAGSQPWPFPSSLMLGFLAHACGTSIAVDGVEITKARWFTRDELRREVEAGELVIPSTISISGALIQSWYGGPLPSASG
jgi:NAD+ diphosphatase